MYKEYDKSRSFKHKAFRSSCYAPFVTLLFDPRGYVRACCQSWTHSLGNIARKRLNEIWQGSEIQELRQRLIAYDLPRGCATCQWQIEQKNYDLAFAKHYDRFRIDSQRPPWPQSMDFLLSNRCNLECVQCFGELSSSIRKNQEKLPPLERVYGDEFFEDLRAFLPHLAAANFLGGEPFLSEENYRIWEMLIEDHLEPTCTIVTNGTVYGKRVERILDRLSFVVSISLDGATKQTVESIRRNARFETIMQNVDRFSKYTRERGTYFNLGYCLMPQNHHEFPDFLMLAEDLDCSVTVNKVYQPPKYSLNALTRSELGAIVESWERRDAQVRKQLRRHRPVWERQLSRLRTQLHHPEAGPQHYYLTSISSRFGNGAEYADSSRTSAIPRFSASRVGRWLGGVSASLGKRASDDPGERRLGAVDPPTLEGVRDTLARWSGGAPLDEILIDGQDVVRESSTGFAGLDVDRVAGRSMADIMRSLREQYGADADVTYEENGPSHVDRIIDFVNERGKRTSVRWIAIARRTDTERPPVAVWASVRSDGGDGPHALSQGRGSPDR